METEAAAAPSLLERALNESVKPLTDADAEAEPEAEEEAAVPSSTEATLGGAVV